MKTLHTLSHMYRNRYMRGAGMTRYTNLYSGTAKEVGTLLAHPDQIRGEYVVIVAGK